MTNSVPNDNELTNRPIKIYDDKKRPSQAFAEFADLLGRLLAKRWREQAVYPRASEKQQIEDTAERP